MRKFILLLSAAVAVSALASCQKDQQSHGDLTISSDKVIFAADANDALTLTVKGSNDADLTSSATFYYSKGKTENYIKMDGNIFKTSQPGGYKVYAKVGKSSSDPISVMATPVDSKPDAYENFYQNVLILQFTSQGCQYCHRMTEALESFEGKGFENYVIARCYTTIVPPDELHPAFWEDLYNPYNAGSTAIPVAVFNLDKQTWKGAADNVESTAQRLKMGYESVLQANPATTGVSAYVMAEGDGAIVRAKVKLPAAGTYRVAAWMLEDGILAQQTTTSGQAEVVHNFVLRAMSSEEPTGVDIVAEGASVHDFEHTFSAADLVNGDINNASILVLVSKKNSRGSYQIDNAISCQIGDAVAFRYND